MLFGVLPDSNKKEIQQEPEERAQRRWQQVSPYGCRGADSETCRGPE